ncbi:MAG: hypothetical protein WCL23_00255 [Candidatus Moraniibacteriota bacterium]
MIKDDFLSAVLRSITDPAQYGIEDDSFSGYILIDATDISKKGYRSDFINKVKGDVNICGQVSRKIAGSVTGDMNTDAEVTIDSYRFQFKITKYERDRDHEWVMVEDPLPLPEEEVLGRFVELTITYVERSAE